METIKNNAVFIADVHFIKNEQEDFFEFLYKIKNNKKYSQLFLLGDIFELLIFPIKKSVTENQKVISLINEISENIEIFYFEGNHDFQLKNLFPKVKIIPYSKQPKLFLINNKKILISHGDINISLFYKLYKLFISNMFVLKSLEILDIVLLGKFYNKLRNKSLKKPCFKKFLGFKNFIENRLKKQNNANYYLEGHFHQGITFNFDKIIYLNLHSFDCNKSFFIVESKKDTIVFSNINLKDF